MNIELALAFLAVFCAAWMLGHNSGAKQWKAKFDNLSELSMALIALLETEGDKYNEKQTTNQDTQHDTQ